MSYISYNTVNRSNNLHCACCKKHLPMDTYVGFQMSDSGQYEGKVFCIECRPENNRLMDDCEFGADLHNYEVENNLDNSGFDWNDGDPDPASFDD